MKFKKSKGDAAAPGAPGGAAGDVEIDEDDAGEALPANVAGMAVVPASVVKSLGLDSPAGSGYDEEDDAAAEEEGEVEEGGTGPWMLLLSVQGKGKRIALDEFKQQGRGGSGKKGLGLAKGDRLAALCLTGMGTSLLGKAEPEHVIIGSQEGVVNRFDVSSIRVQKGRATKGVGVMKLRQGDTIRDITLLPAEDVALLPPSSASPASSASSASSDD